MMFGWFQLGEQTRINIPYNCVRTMPFEMFSCNSVCGQHQRPRTYPFVSLVQRQDGPRTAHVPVPLCMRTTQTSVYVQIGKSCSAMLHDWSRDTSGWASSTTSLFALFQLWLRTTVHTTVYAEPVVHIPLVATTVRTDHVTRAFGNR